MWRSARLNGLMPAASKDLILLLLAIATIAPLSSIIFYSLRGTAENQVSDLSLVVLALGLTIMAPITVWTDNSNMIGYLNSIVYHNPTTILLRLFLIPVSLLALTAFQCKVSRSRRNLAGMLLISTMLVIASTLAKPSYTIALIPGISLLAAWRVIKSRFIDWTLLMLGLVLPGVLILGLQYLSTFQYSPEGAGIGVGFLKVFGPACTSMAYTASISTFNRVSCFSLFALCPSSAQTSIPEPVLAVDRSRCDHARRLI